MPALRRAMATAPVVLPAHIPDGKVKVDPSQRKEVFEPDMMQHQPGRASGSSLDGSFFDPEYYAARFRAVLRNAGSYLLKTPS